MTAYVAVYDDSERDPQLPASRIVVDIHRRLGIPATFCIVTKPLEDDHALARAYRDLLSNPADDGLIRVIPHSHTHAMLLDHKTLGKGIEPEKRDYEIRRSKVLVEDIFGREAAGFRSPNGFYQGWQGHPDLLGIVNDCEFRFLSSDLMGPGDTVPAPLTQPYFHEKDGFPDLLEVPGHDWHDNVLSGWPPVPAAWPPCVPAGMPNQPPRTPEEKFAVYRPNMEWCVENRAAFYSPALHPWSIRKFDPSGSWVEMMLRHTLAIGMTPMSMPDFAERFRSL